MTTTRKTVARLLPLLALFALAPLTLGGCVDAGDSPGDPTGPGTRGNPEIDAPGAKITVTNTVSNVFNRDAFNILIEYRNGEGRPVEGIGLVGMVEANFGPAASCFGFPVNPTITDAAGRASMRIDVAPDCAAGSYTIVVESFGANPSDSARARGTTGVTVDFSVVSVTLSGPASLVDGVAGTFVATAVVNHPNCDPVFDFIAPGGTGSQSGSFLTVSFPEGAAIVQASAICRGKPRWRVLSNILQVTVAPAP